MNLASDLGILPGLLVAVATHIGEFITPPANMDAPSLRSVSVPELTQSPAHQALSRCSSGAARAMHAGWLSELRMPDIPVEDDVGVQRRFDFYARHPVGSESLNRLLVRCSEYQQTIQVSLARHKLPTALLALVFVESGCLPTFTGPNGGGLWQLEPDVASFYHLKVIPGVVDERHSVQKSTDAAVRYLSDLYREFGDWELVIAAYEMGPKALNVRLNAAPGTEKVSFWNLVNAKVLSRDVASYVASVETVALILANLSHLKFDAVQTTPPQDAADLIVPANTPLGVIARAAGMNLQELEAMNLDLKRGITPDLENFTMQVSRRGIWQAQDRLNEHARDVSGTRVPSKVDWARQRSHPR